MDFFNAELRYLEWKKQYEGGQIDADTFEEWVNTIYVRGPDSTAWHIGINTGLWYRQEGLAWVEDNPHKKYAQPAVSAEPPPPPPPRETNQPPAAPLPSSARPGRKSSTLTIVLIALGGFICLGFLVVGVFFASLLPEILATPTPQTAVINPPFPPSPVATEAPAPPTPPQTETPQQQPSGAAPNPARAVVFEDDFSDEGSGWQDIRVGENFDTLYFEGGYLIVVTTKGYTAQADPAREFSGPVSVEVDAVQNTGSPQDEFGLMCHYSKNSDGTGSYYYFAIASDGLGVIYRVDHGQKSLLLTEPPGDRSDVILPARQVNRLQADCLDGGRLSLSVNGAELVSASDSTFTGGGAGLRADSEAGETEIRFDNFVVFH